MQRAFGRRCRPLGRDRSAALAGRLPRLSANFKRSLRRLGVLAGSPRDRAVSATVRSLMRAESLPAVTDTVIAFGTGRALIRRVPRENLWIVYQASDAYIELLTVKNEPPIPADD